MDKPLVLVVEDEPETAELVASSLSQHGCEVLVCHRGQDALDAALQLPPPDLILLDLGLPDVDGRRVLDRLRSDPTVSGIPVVVLSAAHDAMRVRATDNIPKHALLDGLRRVIPRLRRDAVVENDRVQNAA